MKKICGAVIAFLLMSTLLGCTMLSEERVKLRDLDFTVLSPEKIPGELMTIIQEKGGEPFQLTYRDKEFLYISIGYGQQESGGYSIAVNELYLTDSCIYVSTSLLGPGSGGDQGDTPTNPCIVIKTEYLDETVIFE